MEHFCCPQIEIVDKLTKLSTSLLTIFIILLLFFLLLVFFTFVCMDALENIAGRLKVQETSVLSFHNLIKELRTVVPST